MIGRMLLLEGKTDKGIDYPNLFHFNEMFSLLKLNELVKINKKAWSLWMVGARCSVGEINLEVGMFLTHSFSLLQAGKSLIPFASYPSCFPHKSHLLRLTAVSPLGSQSILS